MLAPGHLRFELISVPATSLLAETFGGLGMFSLRLQVRPSDCDSYGHVNNAVYMSFFEQALAECLSSMGYGLDWRPQGEYSWQARSLTLEYRQAAAYGDALEGNLWSAKPDPVHPAFGFEVVRRTSSSTDVTLPLFRALGAWSRNCRATDESQQIPAELMTSLPRDRGILPRDPRKAPDPSQAKRYFLDHRVERNEVDPTGHIHLQALFRMLEESLSSACDQAGWPVERWLAAGFFTVQTRHDCQILSLPKAGEDVRIMSQLVEVRRLGGTWLIEAQDPTDGRLLARDYSTGIHLNLEGRPASPPSRILENIQFGSAVR
jgi:YbgC/YbaW family acyl-CoA thioester hydrolase